MLATLKKKPFLTSILIVFLYALWFIVPMIFTKQDPNAHGISGINGALKMLKPELITAGVLLVFVAMLGWWKQIGFVAIKKGGVKFLIPICLLILLMLSKSWTSNHTHSWFMGFQSPQQLSEMLGIIFLLGFVEEGIFRGVLFYGLSTKLKPFYTVFISALVFGLFHAVNIFAGADPLITFYQMVHAFSMGFLYASLRLMIGAIWPLMILHGLWDFSLFVLQTTAVTPIKQSVSITASITAGLMISTPAILYGIFVYWRWSKTK